MKARYSGPSGVTNSAVGALNPDKGPVLQSGHVYEVTGEMLKELPSDDWKRVNEPKAKED